MSRKTWILIGVSAVVLLVIIYIVTSYEKPVQTFQYTISKKAVPEEKQDPGVYKVVAKTINTNVEAEIKRIKDASTLFKEYTNKKGEKKAFFCEIQDSEESYKRRFKHKGFIEYKKDGIIVGSYCINIGYGEELFDGKIKQSDINGDGKEEIILIGAQGGRFHCDGVAVFDLFNEKEYYLERVFYKGDLQSDPRTAVLSWSKNLGLREDELILQYLFSVLKESIPLDLSKCTYP